MDIMIVLTHVNSDIHYKKCTSWGFINQYECEYHISGS